MTSIASEFIRRASDVIEGDDFEAEDWDTAIASACLAAIRPMIFCITPSRFLSPRERTRIAAAERAARDYDHPENAYSPHGLAATDYGRGTVALIVGRAEEKARDRKSSSERTFRNA